MDLGFPFSPATFLVLVFLLFKLVRELKKSKHQKATQKLPPGPWKLPLIGNMHHLAGSLPHRALRDLARKHGPLMHLQLGEISAIVVSSPRIAKEVMKTHDLSFANRPELLAAKIMSYNNLDIAFSPYGDYWRQMRKICTLELLSAKNVRSFCSIREDEVFQLIKSIELSSGSLINLSEKLFSLTNTITSRAAFGRKCKDQDELIPLIQESMSLSGGFDLSDLFPSFKLLHVISRMKPKLTKMHMKVDEILEKIINEHKEILKSSKNGNGELGGEYLVDLFLGLQENGDLEFPISTNNIKAVILDVFTAGTESSSTTIEWAMSEMIRNQRVMAKAQAEVRRVIKGKKRIHETDIQNFHYLKLVIKETLRIHPPGPLLLPRECREECEIDGYKIPIKTKVIVNAWAIGTDPEFWDNAESFEPERFSNSDVDFKGNSFEFIPFGAGRRVCPGISFGLANVEMPLAQLLYHFNWKLPNGINPKDLDMTETFGASVRRRKSLFLIPTLCTPFFDDSSPNELQ